MDFFKNIKIIFTDIKIAHTVFALPFAVMSAFLASEGMPDFGDSIINDWDKGKLKTTVNQFMSHIKEHGLYLDQINCCKGFYEALK